MIVCRKKIFYYSFYRRSVPTELKEVENILGNIWEKGCWSRSLSLILSRCSELKLNEFIDDK
jgi:hypothetical protein